MGVPASYGVSASGKSPYARDQANGVIQGTIAAVRATEAFAFLGPFNLTMWASYSSSLTMSAGSLTAVIGAAGAVAAGTSISSTLLPKGTTMSAIGGTNVTLVLPIYGFNCTVSASTAKLYDLPDTTWLLGAAVTGTGIPANTTVTAINTAAVGGAGGVVTISNAASAAPVTTAKVPLKFALAVNCIASGADAAAIFTGAAIVFNATLQLERCFDGGGIWIPCSFATSGTIAQWTGATQKPTSTSFVESERGVIYRLNALAYTGITDTTLNYRVSQTGQGAQSLSVPIS